MATEFVSQIGSGVQPYRKENHGKFHRPGLAVNVTNWEDANPVYEIRTMGFEVDENGTVLPSGVGALATRRVIAVYNTDGTNTVYVGQSGIDSNSGYPVAAGTEKAFALAANLDIWAICATGETANVRTMEIA